MAKKDPAEVREIFDHFDSDRNGVIDRSEWGQLLEALGGGFSEQEAQTGLQIVDRNNNGRIEFDEFIRWWDDQ
jgi:Ca2+-binding EF-hand superfamily protein